LNSEQKQAIEYAVGVRDVYLIWGPPGTGKTTIVPEIVSNYIRLHLEGNQKILVCSYTNTAVDNVVKKLFDDERFRNSIVRFGDSTLTKEYKEVRFDEQLKKKRKGIEKGILERIQQLQRGRS
jgi:superfamily I DNA and/or RNA helicase